MLRVWQYLRQNTVCANQVRTSFWPVGTFTSWKCHTEDHSCQLTINQHWVHKCFQKSRRNSWNQTVFLKRIDTSEENGSMNHICFSLSLSTCIHMATTWVRWTLPGKFQMTLNHQTITQRVYNTLTNWGQSFWILTPTYPQEFIPRVRQFCGTFLVHLFMTNLHPLQLLKIESMIG